MGGIGGILNWHSSVDAGRVRQMTQAMKPRGPDDPGLEVLGGGAALGGLVLGATTVYIIEHQLWRAAGFALAGAVLTFFGLMHGERIGIGQSPGIAASYVMMAIFLGGCARFSTAPAAAPVKAPVPASTPSLAPVA